MKAYLFDKEFLKKLDYSKEKQVYVRIISITNDEYPRETIEGKATGGSINVDGASAVRRSCTLSMVALDTDSIITDEYWCYNNKFKLEVGLKNLIDDKYPDIIWFDMGIYIITSFNKSKNTTGSLTISLSGKDKMCRLNGEVSGNIMMPTDFGTIEKSQWQTETGEYISSIDKLPIYDIILNAVKEYGGERQENIIINDLDKYGYELWEYRGDSPMYLFIKPGAGEDSTPKVINMTLNNEMMIYYLVDSGHGPVLRKPIRIDELEQNGGHYYSMNTLNEDIDTAQTPSRIEFEQYSSEYYYVSKISFGETAGYYRTPLVYGNDLILNAGETITSLLDKLKAMLGDFEYFYDLKGRFVFQKKKTYIQELFSPVNGDIIMPSMTVSKYSYKFENENLFTAISNAPNISNLKNDFAIWGTRKTANGEVPIHARYAIDKKPIYYYTFNNELYSTIDIKGDNGDIKPSIKVDWRELIYLMALDFYKHGTEADYGVRLEEKNSWAFNGLTGYEHYYSDMQGFWRQLYNPLITDKDQEFAEQNKFEYYSKGHKYAYWNIQIFTNPTALNFWIDFLDVKGELNNYSIKDYKNATQMKIKVGRRSKVINENTVNSIYHNETPEVLFMIASKDVLEDYNDLAFTPIWIQENMRPLFLKSAQGVSAIARANELIYQHTASVESISITSIPIYYLEPNTRIYIKDQGDYTLDKISYSLNYNGTMTLSGNKIMKQFY